VPELIKGPLKTVEWKSSILPAGHWNLRIYFCPKAPLPPGLETRSLFFKPVTTVMSLYTMTEVSVQQLSLLDFSIRYYPEKHMKAGVFKVKKEAVLGARRKVEPDLNTKKTTRSL
jgi:hypothetical protein